MKKLKLVTFLPPFVLLLAVVVMNFVDEKSFTKDMTYAYSWVIETFGWLVSLLSFSLLVLCAVIYISPFGRVVIGGPDAKPLLSKWRLFTIILCTNIAIGVLFWGPVEPLYYFSHPPQSSHIEANSPDAALFAISTIYLHWTSTPYAIATIVSLMFAFAYYNMKKPFSLGAPLSPLLGRHGSGRAGQIIDSICLYTLVMGMAGSLGGAMMLLGGGLNHVLGIEGEPSKLMLAFVTIAIVGTFTVSAVSGLMKGIRLLSNINTIVLIAFLVFILFLGPTRFILSFAVEGLGHFFSNFFEKALFTGAAHQDSWPQKWTEMHFANWFAWAPIMGVFLGRIAYGYTVRTYLIFNVILPAFFTAVWMAIFCGATLHMEMYQDAGLVTILENSGPERVMYAFMEQLPLAKILIPTLLVTAFLSFVTAADSNTSAMSAISSTGISPESPEPSIFIKIVWGCLIGLLSWIMITFARLDGIRMLSTLGGLPAMFLCLGIGVCAVKVALNPVKYDTFKNGYDSTGQPLKRWNNGTSAQKEIVDRKEID